MKLTRKKAIQLCIELWTWLAETGKKKKDWPEWELKSYHAINCCWFCEYGTRTMNRYDTDWRCYYCPLIKLSNEGCSDTFYTKWAKAKTRRTRKKYAKLFLAQIKTLRNK